MLYAVVLMNLQVQQWSQKQPKLLPQTPNNKWPGKIVGWGLGCVAPKVQW